MQYKKIWLKACNLNISLLGTRFYESSEITWRTVNRESNMVSVSVCFFLNVELVFSSGFIFRAETKVNGSLIVNVISPYVWNPRNIECTRKPAHIASIRRIFTILVPPQNVSPCLESKNCEVPISQVHGMS